MRHPLPTFAAGVVIGLLIGGQVQQGAWAGNDPCSQPGIPATAHTIFTVHGGGEESVTTTTSHFKAREGTLVVRYIVTPVIPTGTFAAGTLDITLVPPSLRFGVPIANQFVTAHQPSLRGTVQVPSLDYSSGCFFLIKSQYAKYSVSVEK